MTGYNSSRYTRTAMALHWMVATLMIAGVALIWSVDYLPENWVRPAVDTHKSVGITVLGLALLRMLWRQANPPPALPANYPQWQRRLSHVVHIALYGLMIALPLTGWMHDSAWSKAVEFPMELFYLFPWPRISAISNLDPATKEALHALFGAWHTWLSYALYALLALHLAGALKHQWLDGERQLQRMWS